MKCVEMLSALLGLAAFAHGHMQMTQPPPLRSKFNPNTPESLKDYSMTAPLSNSGSDFPCKGYHNLPGQPAAKSVATWTPGQSVTLSLTGTANHGGGSCQASLSYDQGRTFKVVYSWIGGCPIGGDSSRTFPLPSDTPPGEALFAWTWFNQLGNREMYMNCAVVTIKPGKMRRADVGFSSRPGIFVANVNNGMCTFEGKDLEFPEPGPDVARGSVQGTSGPGSGACLGWNGSPAPQPAPQPVPQPAPRPAPQPGQPIWIPRPRPAHQPAAPQPVPQPAPRPAPPQPISPPAQQQPAPPSGGGGGSGYPAGSSCSKEGQWNCYADGAQTQRCGSGRWSPANPLSPGMFCKPGLSDYLIWA